MLTDRVLPPAEWPSLKATGCDLGGVIDQLDPRVASIVVVEDGDQIVGCWAALLWIHAEGVWVAPQHRGKTSVARRLWRRMRELVHEAGFRDILTAANTPEIAALLNRPGSTPVPQEYRVCL